MSAYRLVQILALTLVLLAGFLWSQRLGEQVFAASLNGNAYLTDDQVGVLQKKMSSKKDPIELLNFGRKFLKAGNPEFAIVPLQRAVKLNPQYRDAWFLLGYSEIQLGNNTNTDLDSRDQHFEKARTALGKAHELDPSHQATNNLLKSLGEENL